jgi:hypothetical protein
LHEHHALLYWTRLDIQREPTVMTVPPLLDELRSEALVLGERMLPFAGPAVPAFIELSGDVLRWRWFSPEADLRPLGTPPRPEHAPRPVQDTRGMLEAFLGIGGGRGVLRFARRYGPLELCATHGAPRCWVQDCRNAAAAETVHEERVDVWLHHMRLARAYLTLAARLRQGNPGSDDEWLALLTPWGQQSLLQELKDEREEQRALATRRSVLAVFLNEWLGCAQMTPALRWGWLNQRPPAARDEPVLELAGGTFGALALQLAGAIAGADLTLCDGCQRLYMREGRRPQAGRRNFCTDCVDEGIPERLRARDYRARRRAKEDRA